MQGFTLSFQLLFLFVILLFTGVLHGGSTWWFIKDLYCFSKCSSRLFSKKLKHYSSCIPKSNAFYLIFWRGVVSLLIISLRVSYFTSSGMGYLNPSPSSLGLYWDIFHLKPSLKIIANYGAYKWSKFFIYPPGEISFSYPCWYQFKFIVSVSGRISPHSFEMFSISPLQPCSFRCWFSNNSVWPFS